MTDKLKKYETIGCCGIDCGLCPRFCTKGNSACPGCGGFNFIGKHPTCGVLTCCVTGNKFEVCSDCKDYPCKRFDSEKAGHDSFVTHKKMFVNLGSIKDDGIEHFIGNQKIRMDVLSDLLINHDAGRSKSFFCVSCALLPIDKLQEARKYAEKLMDDVALKDRSDRIKDFLTEVADSINIDLKLRNKK